MEKELSNYRIEYLLTSRDAVMRKMGRYACYELGLTYYAFEGVRYREHIVDYSRFHWIKRPRYKFRDKGAEEHWFQQRWGRPLPNNIKIHYYIPYVWTFSLNKDRHDGFFTHVHEIKPRIHGREDTRDVHE